MCFCLNQVGEGEKLVKALFALARELQPAIIFLGQPAWELQCTFSTPGLKYSGTPLKKNCPWIKNTSLIKTLDQIPHYDTIQRLKQGFMQWGGGSFSHKQMQIKLLITRWRTWLENKHTQ